MAPRLKEEVKTRILTEAKKEFLNHGYEKASLRQVMRRAGLSTPAYKPYFKNKNDIFLNLVADVSITVEGARDHPVEFAMIAERAMSEDKRLIKVLSRLSPEVLYMMMDAEIPAQEE